MRSIESQNMSESKQSESEEKILNLIKKVYFRPGNLGGIESTLRALKKEHPSIKFTRKDVADFISKQSVNQVFQNAKKPVYHSIVGQKGGSYQGDLMFLEQYSKQNKNYKGMALFIHVDTRMLYAYPFKTKSMTEMHTIVKKFLEEINHEIVGLTTDSGVEWKNAQVSRLLTENNIEHFVTDPGNHTVLSRVDRVTRTLREKIERWFKVTGKVIWIDVIEKIVYAYNHAFHHGIDMEPASAGEDDEARIRVEARQRGAKAVKEFEALQVGDQVRLLMDSAAFVKKTQARYSDEVYTIDSKDGFSFRIRSAAGVLQRKKYQHYKLLKISSVSGEPLVNPVHHIEDLVLQRNEEDYTEEEKKPRAKILQERQVTRRVKKEGIEEKPVTLRRNLRERKPNQLESAKGKIVY